MQNENKPLPPKKEYDIIKEFFSYITWENVFKSLKEYFKVNDFLFKLIAYSIAISALFFANSITE